jgi:hypothetical protein
MESNAAIRCLSTKMRTEKSIVVPLVTCILFACREFIGGGVDSALLHVFSGLRILDQANHDGGVVSNIVVPVYSRLNILCLLFGHDLPSVKQNSEEETCGPFLRLDGARRHLFAIMERSLRFIRLAYRKAHEFQVDVDDWVIHTKLLTELERWRTNLDDMLADSHRGPAEYLLRMHHRTIFIWLSVCLSIEECAADFHVDGFREVVELGGRLTRTEPREKFSFEMRIIPPLYYTAMKCRDPSIRREALQLLRLAPPREGLWDARIAMRVAQRAIELEERDMGGGILPSESTRIHAVKELPAEFRSSAASPVLGTIEVEFTTKPWGLSGDCNISTEQIIL